MFRFIDLNHFQSEPKAYYQGK